MIKAIAFDIDNTIYDYSGCDKTALTELCSFACDKYSLSPEEFKQRFDAARAAVKKSLGENVAASHNRILYMQKFLEDMGLNPAKGALELYDVYWNSILDNMELFPYVLPLMKYLKEHDIRIGMLTDLTAHIQHRKIARLGLEDYIEVLVTSEEAGAEKPSLSAYDLLVSKFDVDRKDILMIGDSLKKDVEGALNAGLRALLYKKECSDTMDKMVIKMIEEE